MSFIRFRDNWGGVFSAAALPDGQRVLSGCGDADIRLWELTAGTEPRRFQRPHKCCVLRWRYFQMVDGLSPALTIKPCACGI